MKVLIPMWMNFLEQQGANISDNGHINDFGDVMAEKQLGLATTILRSPLSSLAVIAVTGADAAQLLQGQFTCDVNEVNATQSRLGAWCTPKGRITVIFRLLKRDDTYLLLIPQFQLEYCLKRLKMFVFRSDVKLESLDKVVVAYRGLDIELAPDAVQTDEHSQTARIGASNLYYQLSDPKWAAQNWLKQSFAKVGAATWQLLKINAGFASLSPDTVDAFIPQMLHLQHLNAVNFTKGCYTGQEIVARTHYLGKIKRKLYLAYSKGECPKAGADLYSTADTRGQSPGLVVNAQTLPEGGCQLLLVAQEKLINAQALRLHSSTGDELNLIDLPYPTPEKK